MIQKKPTQTRAEQDQTAKFMPSTITRKSAQKNIRIQLEDGVELCCDVYLPQRRGVFPAIVEMTPYGAENLESIGQRYAARGFLFFAVDCRGRYRSGGVWEPLTHDCRDGHAVLRFAAAFQSCNGRVGTRGHSYAGYSQLLAAPDAPECLRAMCVSVAPGDPFVNVPFQGGAYDLNDFTWLLEMTGRVCESEEEEEDHGNQPPSSDLREKEQAFLEAAYRARPFRDLDLRLGVRQKIFREWIRHWILDDYWRERSVGKRAAGIRVPTLFVSGWWDGNGRGAPVFFEAIHAVHRRIVIGPWNHDLDAPDCKDLPQEDAKATERAALRNTLNDEFAWFDQHLRGIHPGPSSLARASLFLTGLYQWIDLKDWPPSGAEKLELRLGVGGVLTSNEHEALQGETSYLFDPDDPTPYASPEVDGERMPFDQAELHAKRHDLLLFETAPVDAPLILVGDVSAALWADSDAPDFDLYCQLFDVYPDGRAIFLTDGIRRARFRRGFTVPQLTSPGEVHAYEIDMWHVGHVLRRGHRLRLHIASAALFRFDVNPCTGGDLATETHSRRAHITVHHNAEYPSRLVLSQLKELPQ